MMNLRSEHDEGTTGVMGRLDQRVESKSQAYAADADWEADVRFLNQPGRYPVQS